MTTTKTRRSSKSSSRTRTRGFDAVDWIQKHCILAEGDYYGQPFRLRDWQKRFLLKLYAVDGDGHRLVHQALLGLPSGNGKALDVRTPLLTPYGWSSMGEIQPGDEIYALDGTRTKVTFVSQVHRREKTYRVSFKDGSELTATDEHRWLVRDRANDGRERVLTTQELVEIGLTYGQHRGRRWMVPVPGSLEGREVVLPVPPYTLGAWLGDGGTYDSRICAADPEVLEGIKADGYEVKHRDSLGEWGYWIFGLKPILRLAGVLGAKHIPVVYLTAPEDQRWELLRGLLDTDGTIDAKRSQVEYTSINLRLAEDVLALVRSLGIKATLREGRAMLNGRYISQKYRVTFTAHKHRFFKVNRKQARVHLSASFGGNAQTNAIVAIEPVEPVDSACITVDHPSGVFLAGRCLTPTHNSELAAAIAAYELASDTRVSPIVAVAAASWEQADHVFGALKTMCRVSPTLSQVTEVFDTEILLRGMPGRAYRVAAVAGTNEGQRPTCVIGDELHEWLGQRERVWTVLTKSLAKRQDALALGITTAGWDHESVCFRLYEEGRKVESGEIPADGFLFEWHEAPPDVKVDDRKVWRACNPALGDFLAEANLAQSFHALPEHEFRRYHLNQWVTRGHQWLPLSLWEPLGKPHDVPADERIVLVFDGSVGANSAGLVGCTLEGYVFVIAAWEKPIDAGQEWMVPRAEVDETVASVFERWEVVEMDGTRSWWPREFQDWADRYGEERVIDFPKTPVRMGPACQRFYSAVASGQLSHDGDLRLARHLQNAITKESQSGTYITREARGSPRKIDLAVAAVMAYERAMFHAGETEEGPLVRWA